MQTFREYITEEVSKDEQVFKELQKLKWKNLKKTSQGMTLEKEFQGSFPGEVNPSGRVKVFAQYDNQGRYLELVRGFDIVFDMDTRDGDASKLAKEFDNRTKKSIK